MTIEQQKAAEYVRAIRNSKKHAYALQYLRYLNGASLTEPKSPERLSYMAAQAVRMQLHAILKTNAVCEGCIADGATPHSGWCELA